MEKEEDRHRVCLQLFKSWRCNRSVSIRCQSLFELRHQRRESERVSDTIFNPLFTRRRTYSLDSFSNPMDSWTRRQTPASWTKCQSLETDPASVGRWVFVDASPRASTQRTILVRSPWRKVVDWSCSRPAMVVLSDVTTSSLRKPVIVYECVW